MRKFLIACAATCGLLVAISLQSCHHETLEDKAQKIADEYTERYCPTPEKSFQITDSITFDRNTLTFSYYYTLTGDADNKQAIDKIRKDLSTTLLSQLKENTSMRVFKDAGYNFHYVYRSQKSGGILIEKSFSKKEYQ